MMHPIRDPNSTTLYSSHVRNTRASQNAPYAHPRRFCGVAGLCTSSFVAYLPWHYLCEWWKSRPSGDEAALLLPPSTDSATRRLGVVATWKLAAPFSLLWYICNACIDSALVLTTVSSMTLCFSSAGKSFGSQ